MQDESLTKHRNEFGLSSATVPFILLVIAAIRRSGDTPLFIVAIVMCIYAGIFAVLFFPTYMEATRNCDLVDRAMAFTIGSMFVAHVVAIGGAWITDSNSFLFAYPAIATASLMILKNTSLAKTRAAD